MERPFYRHLSMLVPALAFCLQALYAAPHPGLTDGNRAFQDLIYQAYVEDRIPLWESTLRTMQFEYSQNPEGALLYDILLAQYGLIGYYLGNGRKKEGEALLERAEDYVQLLEDIEGYEASAKLFRASFKAYHITLRPWRSIQLGIRSERLINEAMALDEEYPRGYLEKGNMLFFAPSIFGGSKKKSIEYYAKAVTLFEKDLKNNHRWLYLSTLVSLANGYKETGDLASAIDALEKALEYEPGFQWVKNELLPEFKSAQ